MKYFVLKDENQYNWVFETYEDDFSSQIYTFCQNHEHEAYDYFPYKELGYDDPYSCCDETTVVTYAGNYARYDENFQEVILVSPFVGDLKRLGWAFRKFTKYIKKLDKKSKNYFKKRNKNV